jgi:hypothetical protein
MVRKNKYLVLFLVLIIACSAFPLMATDNHISVPLNHRVYPILKNAEVRGIIDTGIAVRPYATSAVLRYLETMVDSSQITSNEKSLIQELIQELESNNRTENDLATMLQDGTYKTYSEVLDTSAIFGARLNFEFAQSLSDTELFDSRNGGDFYIQGDIKDIISFHMNIGIRFDHVEPRIFLKNDFTIPSEGKYDTFWDHQGEHVLYYGIYATPELSVSLLEDNLQLRWASIQRDWGVGTNNLMLSGSARSFNGVEVAYNVSSWLSYSFIAGSLGKFSLENNLEDQDPTNYYDEYFFSDNLHDKRYYNNFSAQRVEVGLPWNLTFGIYESVVYEKRFELGYLNPLSVFMFEQNIMGDFDNMLAGVDLEWKLPGILRFYGTAATTEMNEINPKRFFIAPRNVLALQAGVDVHIPFLSFTSATLQYTYLPPFFYTHYPRSKSITGADSPKELSYVNEGQNLGYPLRPNSDEILLAVHMQARDGWDGSLTVKYQRRSGQYGFNIDKYMSYGAANAGVYADKDFNGNIFEQTVGLKATVNKTFKSAPIQLSVSYMMNLNTTRIKKPYPLYVWNGSGTVLVSEGDPIDYSDTPVVEYKVEGPWKPWTASHAVQLGVNIWY